jgi:hypothetical protein
MKNSPISKNPVSGNRRNVNFQASRRLEGVDVPLVTLTAEEALARIAALRRHYER